MFVNVAKIYGTKTEGNLSTIEYLEGNTASVQ